ncbi:MAG: hypothetical protein HY928_08715 [Elusimicrobia bacterium]|nr:hypothetical protein [Elusimicrobiota bacterium]
MSDGRTSLGTGAKLASGAARLKSAVAVFLAGWLVLSPFAQALALDPNPGNSAGAFPVRVAPNDVYPPVPVNDLSAVSGAVGQALVQWTAPDESHGMSAKANVPVVSYQVRIATFSVLDLGGNTTSWFNAATPLPSPVVQLPGNAQAVMTSLEPGPTYFLAVKSVDDSANVSDVDSDTHGIATQPNVKVKGIAGVTDLTAVTGVLSGEVNLAWTAPRRLGHFDPTVYEVRASTTGQIANPAQFDAARPLSAFSPSPIPGAGSPGTLHSMTVTGLVPSATYYFAVRAVDSGLPPFTGVWQRNVPAGLNPLNVASARFNPGRPDAVTDLTALPGGAPGQIALTWTAPKNPNGVPMKDYVIQMSTSSVADYAGDTTTWFNTGSSITFGFTPVGAPGAREALTITNLYQDFGTLFFFGLVSRDAIGETSFIDLGAAGGFQAKSRPRPTPPIINVTAVAVSTESGRIDLTWTAPDVTGMVSPVVYDIRASTTANMDDNAAFDAARPLSAFSFSQAPAVSSGTPTFMSVTGLAPLATYYFAIRTADSNPNSAVRSDWVRVSTAGINPLNFAVAPLIPGDPDAVTDLSGLPGAQNGELALSWTAPRNANFTPIASYQVAFATFAPAELGGDATAWFLAASSAALAPAGPPGAAEAFTLSGLEAGSLYTLAVRAVDALGRTAPLAPAQPVARSRGIGPVTDLAAAPDGASGAVDLTWTVPYRVLTTAPHRYDIRVSTTGNLADSAAFSAAKPLSAFTSAPAPAVGTAGGRETVTLTGLQPFTTYFFAVAVEDSSAPVKSLGAWSRLGGRNTTNFAVPSFAYAEPDPISDLTSLPGALAGELRLEWTAPRNQNFIPISSYTVRGATFTPAALGGDATAWFNAATLDYTYYPANLPGTKESLVLSGLAPGEQYFFGLRAFDQLGEAGHLDAGLDPSNPLPQVSGRPRGVGAVTDLVASPDGAAGSVDLTWTAPFRVLPVGPERYAVKVSTLGQIANDAQFAAAKPLSAFSGSPLPVPSAGSYKEALNITGLALFTTYYFAVRVEDSSATVNAGKWLRDTLLARNTANFTVPKFFYSLPEPVSDLTALAGLVEGEVRLTWTAPRNINLIPISRYEVRFATFPVSALANDATAWFEAAPSSAAVATAQAPGALEQLSIGGLYPLSTFYFAVRSVDALGEVSFVDTGADPSDPAVQASTRPLNLPPGTPSGLSAASAMKRAIVSWSDLPAGLTGAGKGLDFAHYRIERSTDDIVFTKVTTQTAFSYIDRPLTAETSYYFRVTARDLGGLESSPSASVSALPFTLAPQEPFGLDFSRNGSSVTLSWTPTRRFETTEPFYDPANPATDELKGYQVYRSTGSCSPYSLFASYGLAVTSHTEADLGQANFYKVMAYNDFKVSTGAVILSPFGDQLYTLPDCASQVVIDEKLTSKLLKGTNGLNEDIYLKRSYHTEENGGEVLQTVEFTPLSGGATPVKNFAFAKPVRVTLRYQVDAQGVPTPATAQAVAQDASLAGQGVSLQALGTAASAGDAKDLGVYWNDGKEYKKLYGQVDTNDQTVTVQTPNLGSFQVRRVFRDSAATFDLSNITTRVVTPNADGKNDLMIMIFDNPRGAAINGKIYDLRGAYVATMAPGPLPNSLQWDGMMNGKVVTSGVYIYQVEGDGKLFNGTMVIAR